jgi:microcystin-dependent protein
MADEAVGAAGGGRPHENRQPFLALSFIIALQGLYPSRW